MDTNVDLSKLTDNDKKELQQFIMQENQQSLIAKSTFPFPSFPSPLFSLPLPPSLPSSPPIQLSTAIMLTTPPAIHTLTDTCWKKCITARISSGKLDRSEESCVANCVDRFMDANMAILKHLEELRGEGDL